MSTRARRRQPVRRSRRSTRRDPHSQRELPRDEPVQTRVIAQAIERAKDELRVMKDSLDKYARDPRYYAPQLQHVINGSYRVGTLMRIIAHKIDGDLERDRKRRRR